jgi:cytochrome c oxidase subunit 2
MGSTAIIITVAYAVVLVVGAVLAVGLWRSTIHRRKVDTHVLEGRERNWLVAVIVSLVALLFATIFFTPYGDSAGGKPVQVVKVTGQQFAWKIVPSTVVAGKKVRFDVTSTDVNHGFGVYTSDLKYLFQVQAGPGELTSVFRTFKTPGIYKVLCLEFCGTNHHLMEAQFEVTAAPGSAS